VTADPIPRRVVLWSGGLDSTLVLHGLALESTNNWQVRGYYPIHTFSIDVHPQIEKVQLAAQRVARKRYLAWATKKSKQHSPSPGLWLQHHDLELTDHTSEEANSSGQAHLWLSMLVPYLRDGDLVHFGYIRGDDFWHYRTVFVRALHAMAEMCQIKVTPVFPLEWEWKPEVVAKLLEYNIPSNTYWTCESPVKKGRQILPCGKCHKCHELAVGVGKHEANKCTPALATEIDKLATATDQLLKDLDPKPKAKTKCRKKKSRTG
jgi:7-cyano-7-deazaguanine synthase in queuosine biosynthesis